jgi:hypothetical protein
MAESREALYHSYARQSQLYHFFGWSCASHLTSHLQRLIDSLSMVINLKMFWLAHFQFNIKKSKEKFPKFAGEKTHTMELYINIKHYFSDWNEDISKV